MFAGVDLGAVDGDGQRRLDAEADLVADDTAQGNADVIADAERFVRAAESFDAWGKRRGSAWSGAPSAADLAAITKTTHRGFTSQEELDNLSLVDLNGRVYDPTVARFLSADPYVQAPYASQSLNRYSYTFDNPLNATDPTGFDAECENSPDCGEAKKADAPVRNSGATPSATQADAQQNSAQQVSGATVPAAAMATAVRQTSTLEQVVVHAARVTGEALAEASATASAAGAAVGIGTIVVIGGMPSNGLSGHDLRDEPLARKAMMNQQAGSKEANDESKSAGASESAGDEKADGGSPPLPDDLVGTQDKDAGPAGNRHNSGPLDLGKGGTGDAKQDFDRLTGGRSAPAPAGTNYPPGTRVGENGISLRPAMGAEGPRIDIPANGAKPHETLHY